MEEEVAVVGLGVKRFPECRFGIIGRSLEHWLHIDTVLTRIIRIASYRIDIYDLSNFDLYLRVSSTHFIEIKPLFIVSSIITTNWKHSLKQ